MNTLKLTGTRFLAQTRRLLGLFGRVEDDRTHFWDTTYLCCEAPLCAELLRRSHDSEHLNTQLH